MSGNPGGGWADVMKGRGLSDQLVYLEMFVDWERCTKNKARYAQQRPPAAALQ